MGTGGFGRLFSFGIPPKRQGADQRAQLPAQVGTQGSVQLGRSFDGVRGLPDNAASQASEPIEVRFPMLKRFIASTAIAAIAMGAMACSPSEPAASAVGPQAAETATNVKQTLPIAKMQNFKLKDQNGQAYDLYKLSDAKAVVLTMHTKGCPIGQQLMPDFKDLQTKYEAKGVKFLMINANTHDTPAMIAVEAKDFGLTIPVLKDTDQSVSEPLGVERATETLILDPKTWKILYQGPINDRVTFGRAKAKADNDFASTTLDAILAGKAVTPSYQMTDGCIISFDKRSKT
jgi:peroxiredoxin